jgi:hypothetical protein
MAWRRGELWLDTDLVWFRERPRGAAAAVALPAPFPSFGPPPGLSASRQRREAWKRRRSARRTRATAIALSPAFALALAGLRSVSEPAGTLALEDPPSLTFRLTPQGPVPVEIPRRASGETAPLFAPATAPTLIEWRSGRSLGVPYGGSLVDGTGLPIAGDDWVTWNPVTDSVPNEPERLYGHERTIRAVIAVASAHRAAHPSAPRVVIGDISREGGGPMTDEHVSHQNGLDVDVYYPRLDRRLRAPGTPADVDRRLAQDLVDRFVAAGAQMVFVGYSTGLHGPTGVVMPYRNHENHMHVRFPPPGG